MPPKTTEAEFEALVARAGIPLSAAQKAGIYQVFGGIEAMQALVRTPLAPTTPVAAAAAEPATTFRAEPGR